MLNVEVNSWAAVRVVRKAPFCFCRVALFTDGLALHPICDNWPPFLTSLPSPLAVVQRATVGPCGPLASGGLEVLWSSLAIVQRAMVGPCDPLASGGLEVFRSAPSNYFNYKTEPFLSF